MINYLNLIIHTLSRFWAMLQQGDVLPLGYWNYLLLFIFVIIQGPTVKLLSGAVVSTTQLRLMAVISVATLASLCADIGWYYLGRTGKFQRYFRKNTAQRKKILGALQVAMEKHYFKVLILGKFSLGLTIPSILAAGISKLSWRKWFPTILFGEILFTCILVLTGFFAAESIKHADQTIKTIGIATTVIFLLILVVYLPYNIRKTLLEEKSTSSDQYRGA